MIKKSYITSLPTLLLLLFSLLSLPSQAAETTAIDTLRSFYKLINDQDCAAAIELRPNYTFTRCKKISNTHIHTLKEEINDNKNAVLLLELDSTAKKKKNYFFGYVRLRKKNDKWVIIGPYKSREDYWLDEYISNHIPEGITDTSKKVIEEHNITIKAAPKKTIDKAIQKNDELNSQVVAPGDSIDADDFTERKQKDLQDSAQSKAGKDTLTTNNDSNPELEKFLRGDYAIEGNYTALLNQLRKYFFQQAAANIILIDKSRQTLYVYDNNNLLLGFYPILSSDNSGFPSGFYSINNKPASESASNTLQQTNTAVSLKRVFKKNKPNQGEPQQNEENKLYFIRDLFDGDSKNSIQLSPIDISKLQTFVSSSTAVYSGQ